MADTDSLNFDPVLFDRARQAATAAFQPKDWKLSDPQMLLLNLQMHAALQAGLDVMLSPVIELAIKWAKVPQEVSSVACADELLSLLVGRDG